MVLAIGGSATNDAGSGMLRALGLRLLDADGRALEEGGLALAKLARIDASDLDPRLAEVQFEVAADVDNPLCGANGASAIFGPQKGANPQQVQALDQALGHFADICAQVLGHDVRDYPAVAPPVAWACCRAFIGRTVPPRGRGGGRAGRPDAIGAGRRSGGDR